MNNLVSELVMRKEHYISLKRDIMRNMDHSIMNMIIGLI